MPNLNARVIVPFAIVTWLLGNAIMREGTPGIVQAAFVVAFAVAVPIAVLWLMSEKGWSTLAKAHRAQVPFTGEWRLCMSGRMSRVPVDHAEYPEQQLRVHSTLRVGITGRALYLSMLFSKIPLLGRFFPELEIKWSAIRSARTYEPDGWFRYDEPGTLVQARYDPNYTGTFVELEIGEPPVYLQLPAALLAVAEPRLPPVLSAVLAGQQATQAVKAPPRAGQ
jgi:hypothetical protein